MQSNFAENVPNNQSPPIIMLQYRCYATENAREILQVRTKYHEQMREYPKMQFKHHLPHPIICLITVLYLIFMIYYFKISIYLHFMTIKSEVR